MMKLQQALVIIGGLSNASKMPWYSWSISAHDCKTGGALRSVPNSTCSTCYALKGNYQFKNVKEAHTRRREALDHPQFSEAFVAALTQLHANGRRTYMLDGKMVQENRFRWFDAGDLQSVEMLEMICDICRQTPQIIHWLPTREYGMVREYLKRHDKFPENLTLRLSAPMMEERPKEQPFGLPFSTVDYVDSEIADCPARFQNNKCGDCSTCWTSANVSYASH